MSGKLNLIQIKGKKCDSSAIRLRKAMESILKNKYVHGKVMGRTDFYRESPRNKKSIAT